MGVDSYMEVLLLYFLSTTSFHHFRLCELWISEWGIEFKFLDWSAGSKLTDIGS